MRVFLLSMPNVNLGLRDWRRIDVREGGRYKMEGVEEGRVMQERGGEGKGRLDGVQDGVPHVI